MRKDCIAFYSATLSILLFALTVHAGGPADLNSRSAASNPELSGFKEPEGSLSLEEARSLALAWNPDLRASSLEVKAAEAMRVQAGLIPNPEIEVELEEFGGTGIYKDGDALETTVLISQPIELGAVSGKRKKVARRELDLAVWDYESKRLDVLLEVTGSFYEVLAAQERMTLAQEILRLTGQVHDAVSEKVRAGKVSPVEEEKIKVVLSTTELELVRTRDDLESAGKNLATMWGSASPLFEKVEGDFFTVKPVPSYERLVEMLSRNPDMARWETEIEYRKAALTLERVEAAPEVSVGFGVRSYEETDDTSYVADASISLPLFDRNQGGISSAKYQKEKIQEDKRSAEVDMSVALSEAYRELSRSFEEARVLREEVVPVANKVFDVMNQGYTAGKFGYLDVLDAERTLFEAKGRYLDSLLTYHKALTEVERLTGGPMQTPVAVETAEGEGEKK